MGPRSWIMKEVTARPKSRARTGAARKTFRTPQTFVRGVRPAPRKNRVASHHPGSPMPPLDYWKERLVQRPYGKLARPLPFDELSVPMACNGLNFYIPLGTDDPEQAAITAWQI